MGKKQYIRLKYEQDGYTDKGADQEITRLTKSMVYKVFSVGSFLGTKAYGGVQKQYTATFESFLDRSLN